MDKKNELQAKLNEMAKEIKTCSDQELDMMGLETSIMLAVLKTQSGEKNENTQACHALLEILREEYSRRNGKQTAEPAVGEVVVAKEKIEVPKTFSQLMSLGDGSVGEPEMVKI